MINILLLSDIHLQPTKAPENQGQIIPAFLHDLEKTLSPNQYSDNFCAISGDLVQDGLKGSYEFFHKKVICPLLKYMPLENIYVIPGNHDLNRSGLSFELDKINKFLSENAGEEKFNDALEKDRKKNPLLSKFKQFNEYCLGNLHIDNYNILGYYVNPIPTVSICFVNSAICSLGGLNGSNDSGNLRVYTRVINKWIQENPDRKKVLIMHHPLSDLEYVYGNELKKLIEAHVDVFINGHTHFDEVEKVEVNNRHYLHFQTPQLLSSKSDQNGYSVLHFDKINGGLQEIDFRQWVDRRKSFSTGVYYSDDGKYRNNSIVLQSVDELEDKLEARWKVSMQSFSMTPSWQERYLDEKAPLNQGEKSVLWDYVQILLSDKNFQICAAPQFGLTCYAQYLCLKAWQSKKEHWLYVDANGKRAAQMDSLVDNELKFHGIESELAKCIVLDNWPYTSEDTQKMLNKVRKKLPNSRVFFCVKSLDADIVSGLDSEFGDMFKLLYMRDMSRKNMRCMATEVNAAKNNFADDNAKLLTRLVSDLKDLNMHRTPYNCIQLLVAFVKNFEDRPVNRTAVLDNVIGMVFDNPGALSYQSSLPDPQRCKFVVGYFCEWLFRKEPFSEYFTEEDFNTVCSEFCKNENKNINPRNIFRAFINNQIIVSNSAGMVRFRQQYWLCYFASERMRKDTIFRQYMIDKHHVLYNQEMVDFYTATDRDREDMVDLMTEQLTDLTDKVHCSIGFPEIKDPYSHVKWAMNETREGITVEKLEEQVSASNLPEEIKDAIADRDYNSVKPYVQTINRFLDEYYVRNLMFLIKSASIAFRNTEFVKESRMTPLSNIIFKAWLEIARVLFAIAPILAKNGYGGIGGQRFTLTGNFSKEFNECVKQIAINIPMNIVMWFSGDVYSNFNAPYYVDHLNAKNSELERYLAALLIAFNRPREFQVDLSKYIKSLPRNSYYLGNLSNQLEYLYRTQFMSTSDQRKTVELLAECYDTNGKYVMPELERDERFID